MNPSLVRRRFHRGTVPFAAGLVLALTTPVLAGPSVRVSVDVLQEIVRVDEIGREIAELRPVATVRPGDVLVYKLRAVNAGDAPARSAHIEDPIPAGTVLIPESVDTAGGTPVASLDGGLTWHPFPVRIEKTDELGRTVQELAPPEAYTHVRWQLSDELRPGESRDVSFKVRIH